MPEELPRQPTSCCDRIKPGIHLSPLSTNPVTVSREKETADDNQPKGGAPNNDPGLVKRLSDAILTNNYFAQDGAGRLCVFSGGVYQQGGEEHIKRRVKELLEAWGQTAKWSSHKSDEVVEYIRVSATQLWERPPLDTINLLNGLLDMNTRELRPHDSAFLSLIQLPVAYDPEARCPAWDKYIVPCFPDDAPDAPYEIAAYLMIPNTSIQKAVLLLGEGSNGKSTFLAALTAFLGRRNCAGLPLQKLAEDRFAVSRLVGKLANICADLPSAHLQDTSVFKALTGTEAQIVGEVKFRDSFEFQPITRLIFSANQPPRSHDATHAFFRRWLVYPFTRTFETGTDTEPVSREWLDVQLTAPKELSGVLNRALDVLPDIQQYGLTESPQMCAAWQEFRQETDPLAVWLDRHTVEDPEGVTPCAIFRNAYMDDCRNQGRTPLTNTGFTLALKRLRPNLQKKQRTVEGRIVWCWIGLRLLAEGESPLQSSQPSQGSQGFPNIMPPSSAGESHNAQAQRKQIGENPVNPVKAVNPIVLCATPTQCEHARLIAEGRQRGKENRNPAGDLGTPEANYLADYFGALAELCVKHWLETEGLRPEWTLLDSKAVREPDFTLNGVRYEVKASPPGKPYVCVNQRQHQDETRRCDYYLPVLFAEKTELHVMRPVPHAEVSQWELAQGHSAYHRRDRNQLQPCLSVQELNHPQSPSF